MEFLVRIEVSLPDSLPEERRRELLRAELERGRELRRLGKIARIWRIPGGLRNVGIWVADDATELHELISGLPMYPYLRAEVVPLALHPAEAAE
jgi:muconolactone D-isomerase